MQIILSVSFQVLWFPLYPVELEGIEPSSKRGINKPSTCLVCELIFVLSQARDNQ